MVMHTRYTKDYMSIKLFLSIPIIQLEIHYREISGHLNEKEFNGFILSFM